MVRGAHDICLVVEVLRDGLAAMDAWDEGRPGEVEGGPLDVAEEGVVFDVLGVVGIDDVARGVQVAHAARPERSVAEHLVVLPVALCREPFWTVFEQSHHQIDGIAGYGH